MVVISLPGHEALGQDLAARLGAAHSPLHVHQFPDGETLVRIDAPVQGRRVILACSLARPDAVTLPLVFAADAARELGAARVGLVAPYLAYMRQDHRFHPGEAVTSRSYARLLSASLDFLVTVDPHLHRWHSLDQIYSLRSQVVAAAPAIARWLQAQVRDPLLVGPDEESAQWVAQVARLAGAPHTVMTKTRRGDRDVSVVMDEAALSPGRTPVLVDDIISTGHTLMAAAGALREAGLGTPVCIGVHALFDDAAQARMLQAGIAQVVTCDTIAHPSNRIALGQDLADAVQGMLDPGAA